MPGEIDDYGKNNLLTHLWNIGLTDEDIIKMFETLPDENPNKKWFLDQLRAPSKPEPKWFIWRKTANESNWTRLEVPFPNEASAYWEKLMLTMSGFDVSVLEEGTNP